MSAEHEGVEPCAEAIDGTVDLYIDKYIVRLNRDGNAELAC